MTVDIPDELVGLAAGEDLPRRLLEDRVAQVYREGKLTTEEVRRVLGLATRMEVDPFLLRYGIFDYTIDMLTKDMETLERLGV